MPSNKYRSSIICLSLFSSTSRACGINFSSALFFSESHKYQHRANKNPTPPGSLFFFEVRSFRGDWRETTFEVTLLFPMPANEIISFMMRIKSDV